MERKLLVAVIQVVLKRKLRELGREVGPTLKSAGLNTKEAKIVMLECLTKAFNNLVSETRAEWEDGKE
jgi:hypothetical protein